MIKLKILYLTVLLFSLLMLPAKLQAAEKYTVQASIFVPAGWQISPDSLEQQKKDILVGLKEVQTAYQQKLSGKTFNFENQVNVVFSLKSPIQSSPSAQPILPSHPTAFEMYYQEEGYKLFPDQDGIVNLIWIIGSADLVESGSQSDYQGIEGGTAIMNHQDILNLTSLGSVKRDQTLVIVAHELGHAFGLVFDGWAKGHPCSEISPNECLQSAPKPLPLGEEFSNAVMGFHNPGLFGSHFNNSTYNPEICKIFDSSFINPTHDSCPNKTTPLLPDVTTEITAISPIQVAPGGIVEIIGRGFGERGTVIFHNPYYATQNYYVNNYVNAQDLLEWTDESIRVYVPTIIGQAQLSSIWKIRILGNGGKVKITSEQFLTINPTALPPFLINADVQISCGKDKKTISGVNITLVRASDPKVILSEVVTDEQGKTSLAYTIEKPQPNDVYLIVPPFIEDASPPQPDPNPIRIPSFKVTGPLFISSSFHYQRCPTSLEDQLGAPLPVPSALPTPSPSFIPEENITGDTTPYFTPYITSTTEPQSVGTTEPQGGISSPQETQLIQVVISNYNDFRLYNDFEDQGSSTLTISNPNDPQNLEWIANTIGPEKRMYAREIYSDQTYKDFEYTISHSDQRSSVANIQILIKIVKKVAKITIGDKDLEIDVKNPQIPLDFHLPGAKGQPQQFQIPVVITYSDGSTLHTALTFNYNPPPSPDSSPPPSAETCEYAEDPQNCPNGGTRICNGLPKKDDNGNDICVYDSSVAPNCKETCNPASGEGRNNNSCILRSAEDEYNECCGVGLSKHVKRLKDDNGNVCNYEIGACDQPDSPACDGWEQ